VSKSAHGFFLEMDTSPPPPPGFPPFPFTLMDMELTLGQRFFWSFFPFFLCSLNSSDPAEDCLSWYAVAPLWYTQVPSEPATSRLSQYTAFFRRLECWLHLFFSFFAVLPQPSLLKTKLVFFLTFGTPVRFPAGCSTWPVPFLLG